MILQARKTRVVLFIRPPIASEQSNSRQTRREPHQIEMKSVSSIVVSNDVSTGMSIY